MRTALADYADEKVASMAELKNMLIISSEELEEQLGVNKLPLFVNACEEKFRERIRRIADRVLAHPAIRAIFVSGPTASGKTTFSGQMTRMLTEAGCPTRLISLDDYYNSGTLQYDAQGRPDFESIGTLDTTRMVDDFQKLLSGETVQLPRFDFLKRVRFLPEENKIRLAERELILVEGLHGLSGLVAGQLSHEQYLGVFIMPWCTLLDGRQLLGSRDLRILRRISRDVLHRGSTALSTIDYWPMIDHTEQQFFPEYLARADEYVNSCLAYEFYVIAPLASAQMAYSLEQYENGHLPGSVYLPGQQGYADLPMAIREARVLMRACSRIPATDRVIVPQASILNEFIR
jgi:uridine kinase